MYTIEHYHKAASVAEAIHLLAVDPEAQLIAGGTDLLVRLRTEQHNVCSLVDIHGLPELQGIRWDSDGSLVLGAATTFSDLLASPLVAAHVPVLAEAAATVAGPQIRNVATLGGNLCNGAVSADAVPPLLILDAVLELTGPQGIRRTPLAGFHTGPSRIAIGRAELLTAIRLPKQALANTVLAINTGNYSAAAFFKYTSREAQDIATINCAAAVRLTPEWRIVALALAFGVAAPTPVRCPTAEAAAIGRSAAPADLPTTLAAIQTTLPVDVAPRTSWRATKDFRMHIITELAARVTAKAVTRAIATQGGNSV